MPLVPPTTPRPQIDSYAPLSRRVRVLTYAKRFISDGNGEYHYEDDYGSMRWYLLPAHDFVTSIQVEVKATGRVKQEPRKRQNAPDAPPDTHAVWPTTWTGTLSCFLPYNYPVMLADGATAGAGEAVTFPVTTDSFLRNPIFVPNGKVQLRWAWDRTENTVEAAPLYEGRITQVTPTFEPGGVALSVELVGDASDAADLDWGVTARGTTMPPIRWKEGDDPSAIAAELANRYGWTSVIEQSGTPMTQAGYIDFGTIIDPVAQLQQRVAPCAYANGQPFLAYMLPGRELHFHTAAFTADPANAVMRSYIVYAHDRGEVIDFSIDTDAVGKYLSGAGNAAFQMMSRADGLPQVRRKTWNGMNEIPPDQRPPKPANEAYIDYPDGAKQVVKFFTGIDLPPVGGGVDPAKFAALLGQRYHAMLADARWTGTLRVRGTHRLVPDPARYVDINYYTMGSSGENASSYLSGLYRVVSVTHSVAETWETSCEILRAGSSVGRAKLESPPAVVDLSRGAIDD